MTDGPFYFDGTTWRSVSVREAKGLAANGVLLAGRQDSRRRLDLASLALFLVGVGSGIWSYELIVSGGHSPLILIPAVIAAWTGLTHLVKREAPRD